MLLDSIELMWAEFLDVLTVELRTRTFQFDKKYNVYNRPQICSSWLLRISKSLCDHKFNLSLREK